MSNEFGDDDSRILDEESVMKRLKPHREFLLSLPHLAAKTYAKRIAPVFASPWRRERANAIQALMVEAAAKRFGGDMVLASGRWLWRAASDLVVQFKMLGANGLPRNFPTVQARKFNSQLALADVPPGMRVTLGYTIDEETAEVVSVRIVAQEGDSILFSQELVDLQPMLPMMAPAAPAANPRRLRAKRDTVIVTTPKTKKAGGGEDSGGS